eukprot:3689559-Prymnesium_polylepis.1
MRWPAATRPFGGKFGCEAHAAEYTALSAAAYTRGCWQSHLRQYSLSMRKHARPRAWDPSGAQLK